MQIFPAIDILDGKCVRLLKGDYAQSTVYGNPLHMALAWEVQGAKWLHVVDLNGARDGKSSHGKLVREIVSQTKLHVQLGGGIRTLSDIKYWLDYGVERVILGTTAVENPEIVAQAIETYGADRIVVALDARGQEVSTRGWFRSSGHTVDALLASLFDVGVRHFIYTDIERDGSLEEPNYRNIRQIKQSDGVELIASGGISSLEALQQLAQIGVSGAIVGKALYTGDIILGEVMAQFPPAENSNARPE